MEQLNLKTSMPNGVIFNAYPDSIGQKLSDTAALLKSPEFSNAFSLFYILPTIFHSDLDRGFSVIDYDINKNLVSIQDLKELNKLGIDFKFDLVLNHLSVGSLQFLDLLQKGDKSKYKDFFIDWNEFWQGHGEMGPDGYILPDKSHLNKLFMRKPGLPILKLRFPDGSYRPYWNTFYQQVSYEKIDDKELASHLKKDGLSIDEAKQIASKLNEAIEKEGNPFPLELNNLAHLGAELTTFIEERRKYLGQMDLNAKSPLVWEFYNETFKKLRSYGAKLIRLDAFAYLHKEVGERNFFNKPGTWEYLDKLKKMAASHDLILLPEIHCEYGTRLHEEVAMQDFPIYDFFLPTLIIDALDRHSNRQLLRWANEVVKKGIQTINMLGCHDGIPVLDLKGKQNGTISTDGLLSDEEIETIINRILERGGKVKNLYGPNGKKIAYYQVNATYFSALGENEQKLLLARAIQMFMPGIPQVWYLDLFAGTNDYEAVKRSKTAGHKEINRTNLSMEDIKERLQWPVVQQQLTLIKLRNSHPAFNGKLLIENHEPHLLFLKWEKEHAFVQLKSNLRDQDFTITYTDENFIERILTFNNLKQIENENISN